MYGPDEVYAATPEAMEKVIDAYNAVIRKHQPNQPAPAWSEDGFKAACADMAAQIQSSQIGGDEELLARNVCVSSLCVAYKNAAMQEGK